MGRAQLPLVWTGGQGSTEAARGLCSYLPEARVDGAHQHSEGLASAAPHGAKHLTQEGDEAQPALHILLL